MYNSFTLHVTTKNGEKETLLAYEQVYKIISGEKPPPDETTFRKLVLVHMAHVICRYENQTILP